MDLLALFAGLLWWQWVGIAVTVAIWLGLTWWLGDVAERRGGDRESGALVGFFLPCLIGFVCWVVL